MQGRNPGSQGGDGSVIKIYFCANYLSVSRFSLTVFLCGSDLVTDDRLDSAFLMVCFLEVLLY